MKRLSLRARLALSFAGATAVALVLFGTVVAFVITAAERAEAASLGIPVAAEDELGSQLRLVGGALAVSLPLAVLGAAALGLWLANQSLKPLREASVRARAARASALDLTLPQSGSGDEWDELATTLNALLAEARSAMERIRRFTADAAHELRTPLTAIIGEAEVTLRRERTKEELAASLAEVRDEGKRLAAVVEALLTLARADAGTLLANRVPCELGELAREAAGSSAALVEVRGSAQTSGDRVLLVRVLKNLIDNGLRHGGGRVSVEASLRDGRASAVVADEGPGISAALLPRLFERFARGDEARSGGIAEAHGGTLELHESTRGARFELLLPLR